MAKTNSSHSSLYDSIVIGGGLSGLILARRLIDAGHSVLVLESRDSLGGTSRQGELSFTEVDFGTKLFNPESAATSIENQPGHTHDSEMPHLGPLGPLEEVSAVLSDLLKEQIFFEEIEAPPVTYDDGRFKPYVGFGDPGLSTIEVIELFAGAVRAFPSARPFHWVTRLEEQLKQLKNCTIQTQSTATRIELESTGEGRTQKWVAKSVQVNGSKSVHASQGVYFTGPATELLGLIDPALFPSKFRTRSLKGEIWTTLHLDLVHASQITDSRSLHILKGANEEPCFGEFLPARADGTQVSHWTVLLGRDQADDEEAVAAGLKQIKKQLKRAYESALNQAVAERILVVPSALGDLAGLLESPHQLPKVDRLWFTSALLTAGNPTIQSVLNADRVAQLSVDPRLSFEVKDSAAPVSELASPEMV